MAQELDEIILLLFNAIYDKEHITLRADNGVRVIYVNDEAVAVIVRKTDNEYHCELREVIINIAGVDGESVAAVFSNAKKQIQKEFAEEYYPIKRWYMKNPLVIRQTSMDVTIKDPIALKCVLREISSTLFYKTKHKSIDGSDEAAFKEFEAVIEDLDRLHKEYYG